MSVSTRPTFDELRQRITRTIAYFGGELSREPAVAWDGYLAALVEWGLISAEEHAKLINLLPQNRYPRPAENPVLQILLGWDSPSDVAKD
ncbi:MAG TPA: hypothetical protein VK968_19855 [Roseimicrobium sp.]|nr:hypothetical protein [Roseimicrobium sp.]